MPKRKTGFPFVSRSLICIFASQIDNMESNTRYFDEFIKVLEAKDIAVLETAGLPPYKEPVTSPYVIIFLNHSGWIRCEFDFEEKIMGANDFFLLSPGHAMHVLETSEDHRATLMFMTRRFYGMLAEMFPNSYRYVHYYQTVFHLTDKQYEGIKACMQMIKMLSDIDHPYRNQLLTSQMDIMAHLTEVYCTENGFVPEETTGVDQLMLQFHNLIAENYTKHREVKFYAEKLCLSPKYFGTVVNQALGYSAGELISRFVMVQARHLLHQHRKFSIQQISEKLGFSDQTAFARYFKKHAGVTPLEYREGKSA